MEFYALYNECQEFKEVVDKLAAYENAEEQGLLIRLPFRIGETVFTVDGSTQGGYDVFDWDVFGIDEDGLVLTSSYSTIHVSPDCIENNVFLTREEAEAALERMNENDD